MPDIIEGVYVTRPELDGIIRDAQTAEQRALDAVDAEGDRTAALLEMIDKEADDA